MKEREVAEKLERKEKESNGPSCCCQLFFFFLKHYCCQLRKDSPTLTL